jgi:hypothetical protein
VKCACPCQQEFTPQRQNQVYVDARHRQRDKDRRWPRKRQSAFPVAPRNGPGERQEAKASGGPPLRGAQVAPIDCRALKREKRRKLKGDTNSAKMLTAYEVSRLLRVSYYTLFEWRKDGEGPPFVRCSPHIIRYPRHRLARWLCAQTAMAVK